MQAAVERLSLIVLAPIATTLTQGSLRWYPNGVSDEGVADAQQLHFNTQDLTLTACAFAMADLLDATMVSMN